MKRRKRGEMGSREVEKKRETQKKWKMVTQLTKAHKRPIIAWDKDSTHFPPAL